MRTTGSMVFALLFFCSTAYGQIGNWLRDGARQVVGRVASQQAEQTAEKSAPAEGTLNGNQQGQQATAATNPLQQTSLGTTPRAAGTGLELTIEEIKYTLRWCPAGTFMMGSPKNEANRNDNETQHQVTLTRGFWMLETPVTQEMWESVMGKNPSLFKGAKLPVEQVSWRDCQEFVGGLNDLNVAPRGFMFAMPTEAQWEYACRAGTTTAFYSGGALNAKLANFETRTTSEVGAFPANAWGFRDMHGNVWEWCADGFSGDYAGGAVTDPLGVSPNQSRFVVRGGSFYDKSWSSRSASRDYYAPDRREYHMGFRLALVPTGETSDDVGVPGNQPSQPDQKTVKDISGNVEQFLRDIGWPADKKEDDAKVIYRVSLNDRPYDLVYLIKKKEEQLIVLTTLTEKIAESQRGAVNEYLTRVNFDDLLVGNFQMDLSDGEIHFRVSIDVEHSVISPDIVKQLTLVYAIPTTDKYLPGIKKNISGSAP